ncbi:MAG TPA: metallophosphoesterase [Candidatus Nanoarchaeia archaeon]|nr:metallophosphoesterase [Candidatus Nanoarchaeia archaeon]
MKILAFTDIHGSFLAIKKLKIKIKRENPDFLLCAGDVSIFESKIIKIFAELDRLSRKIILIHGNHEDESTFSKLCKKSKNLIYIHKKHCIVEGVLVLGHGGGGFLHTDREFESLGKKQFSKLIKGNKGLKIILLTHAPPYRTRLDRIGKSYCGNKSYRKFVEKNKIDLMVCGHIHENFGKEDKIGKTKVINPGPFGKIIKL